MGARSNRTPLRAGSKAPPFQIQDTGGKSHSLAQILAGGPAVVAFFKVNCPTCQLTFPFLERMASSNSLQFVGISQNDLKATEAFRRECGVRFTTLIDDEDKGFVVSNAFGITVVPALFLIEKDGTVAEVQDGFSRKGIEALSQRAGVAPFLPGDYVPEWKAG